MSVGVNMDVSDDESVRSDNESVRSDNESVRSDNESNNNTAAVTTSNITVSNNTASNNTMLNISKFREFRWFKTNDSLDIMQDNCFVKSYLEMTQAYGWQYFRLMPRPKLPMMRKPICYQCGKRAPGFITLSCDGGKCRFPRFKPHEVGICIKCVRCDRNFPTPPSCCWEGETMIKSANKKE